MSFLIILRSDEGLFDADEFRKFFEACPGISRVKGESIGALLSGHFDLGDDSTIVRFHPSRETVAISDDGPAAYEFAIRFQRASKVPLRLVDESLSADLQLKDYETAEDLRSAIVEAIQSAMKDSRRES